MKLFKKPWDLIKIFLTILIVILFMWYFVNNKADFEAVFSIPAYIFIILFMLNSLHFYLNGLFILSILRRFAHHVSWVESFYISIISSFGNYFIPMRGGAAIRAIYLNKTLQFPFAHFIATLYGNYIVIFGVNSFSALLILLIMQINYIDVPRALFLFFGFLFISMLALVLVKVWFTPNKVGRSKLLTKILETFNRFLHGWQVISGDKRLLLTLLIVASVDFIVMSVIYAQEFFALEIKSNLLPILLYNCLSGVSLLVSLTPGSLGIREGIFFITSDVLSITSEQIMQLALLDRGVTVLTLVFWFVVLSLRKLIISRNR